MDDDRCGEAKGREVKCTKAACGRSLLAEGRSQVHTLKSKSSPTFSSYQLSFYSREMSYK